MRRLSLTIGVAATLLLAVPQPAQAIETETFGIEPVERETAGTGVPVDLYPGETTDVALRVWNKTDGPLALELRAAPATLDAAGTPRLGGDPEPVGWIRVRDAVVTLGAGERRVVTVDVVPPRRLEPTERTAAVVARPQVGGDTAPAVLQEIGLVFRMQPAEGAPLVAPPEDGAAPAWLLGVAGVLVVAGIGVLSREARRRRRVALAVPAW